MRRRSSAPRRALPSVRRPWNRTSVASTTDVTPSIAVFQSPRPVRSPTTAERPGPSNCLAASGLRTRARTMWPRCTSARTAASPTKPVEPATRTVSCATVVPSVAGVKGIRSLRKEIG